MEDDRWFVGREAVQQGPFPFHKLQTAAQNSKLRRDDLVWKEGFADWVRADSITGLFEPAPAPTPLPVAGVSTIDGLEKNTSPLGEVKHFHTSITSSDQEADRKHDVASDLSKSQANYFVRQWRGDLSLPVAYWVNGTLVTLGTILLLTVLSSSRVSERFGIFGTGVWILLILAFVAVLTLWQCVGTWRSAGKHASRGGSPGWATAARIMIILGMIQSAGAFVTQLPLVKQAATMLTGKDDVPHYKIRVLRNATELELSGGLSYGTTAAVKTVLEATPNVKLIHLNNLGGWITEGSKLGDLIEKYGLATFTSRSCVSACMMAFIAGKERYLGETGQLGFHSASVGGTDGKVAEGGNEVQREVYLRHGVSPSFVDRATSTAASGMWYPTRDELLSAHVITAIVDDRDYALTSVTEWHDSAAADNQLAAVSAFAVIRRTDAEQYAKIKQDLATGIGAGETQKEISAKIHARLVELLPKYLKTGPNKELVAYWKTQIAEMSELQAVNPANCVRFLFPDAAHPVDIQRLVSQEVQNSDVQALGDLIGAAATRPAKTPSAAEMSPLLTQTMRALEGRHPGILKIVAKPEVWMAKPIDLCEAELVFYRHIMELPAAQSGAMLRYLSSG